MIANVIWLYYVPFEIFQRAFPLFVIFVILCEAGILTAARVPWRRSLSCSIVANLASYVLGYLLVAMVRGTLLPANSPETFNLQSHLWRGFFIAFVLSVLIEVLVYSWMIRGHGFRRLLLLSTAANLASYSLVIGVNWEACRDVTRQMRVFPARSATPEQTGDANASPTKSDQK